MYLGDVNKCSFSTTHLLEIKPGASKAIFTNDTPRSDEVFAASTVFLFLDV